MQPNSFSVSHGTIDELASLHDRSSTVSTYNLEGSTFRVPRQVKLIRKAPKAPGFVRRCGFQILWGEMLEDVCPEHNAKDQVRALASVEFVLPASLSETGRVQLIERLMGVLKATGVVENLTAKLDI